MIAQSHAYRSDEPRPDRLRWAKLSLHANERLHGAGPWDQARMAGQAFALRTWVIEHLGPDADPDWDPEILATDTLAALTVDPDDVRTKPAPRRIDSSSGRKYANCCREPIAPVLEGSFSGHQDVPAAARLFIGSRILVGPDDHAQRMSQPGVSVVGGLHGLPISGKGFGAIIAPDVADKAGLVGLGHARGGSGASLD